MEMDMSHNTDFIYKDIQIVCRGNVLTVENSQLRREFDISNGIPKTIGLWSKSSGKRISTEVADKDFSFIGINMPGSDRSVDYKITGISVAEKEASIFDGERVELEMSIHESVQQVFFVRTYMIYPELPVIASKTSIKCYTSPNVYWGRGRDKMNCNIQEHSLYSCADTLVLSDDLKPVSVVEFSGRTDQTNDVAVEKTVDADTLCGNLLFCKDASGNGLFFLQEAPPSTERRDFENYDFYVSGAQVFSCGWGIEPQAVGEEELTGYRHIIGIFEDDGVGGGSVLKKYLKTRFPLNTQKNCTVMVNPWGCGCFRSLVSETFLMEEFRASGELNATHYQIDDGWQAGKSLMEIEQNNRCAGKDFWAINYELLPNGFEPVLRVAETAGVEPALWVAPSANRHYRDWHEFADILFEYYTRYGFRNIKVDFVKIRTKEAEDNLEKMLRYLRERSEGDIYFNLDTTSGQRPGYFMFLEYGNIFLENRYVCHNWGKGYHPEDTLRNFWNLARYMRAQSLQIEFTDPDIINNEFYEKRGGSRPDVYPCDYWAAVAMFANPLVWLAPSRLSDKVKNVYRDMIDLHRKYSTDIFNGEIYPIGQQPDGAGITGFQSHNHDSGNGLFIVYCEHNAPLKGTVELKFMEPGQHYDFKRISFDGEAPVKDCGSALFSIEFEQNCSWKMFRYTRA
jgi:hypothetical protein